jgi:acyl carrier protein
VAKFSIQQIQERILGHLRENGANLPNDIDLGTPIKDLQLDSWDVVNLVFMIEEEFGIEIPQGGEANFETLADVVDLIVKCGGAESAA